MSQCVNLFPKKILEKFIKKQIVNLLENIAQK